MIAVRQLQRSCRRLQPQRLFSNGATEAAAKPSGPPFRKYFWISTGVMVGIPSVFAAGFVYNLKTDDDFYNHFNDKYPDLMDAINDYVPLNESFVALASRGDIGEVAQHNELQNETLTVVAELKSGRKVRFQVLGSASQEEIEQLAQQHAKSANDRVIAINFDEDAESSSEQDVVIDDSKPSTTASGNPTATIQSAWPPQPRVTWGSHAAKRRKAPTTQDIRLEIDEIRVKQAALEESKYAGRDIDEVDEEIQALETQKIALKALLPRKRFLYIF